MKCFETFKHPQKSAIVEYIQLAYGHDSSLSQIPDIKERKLIASSRSGVDLVNEDETIRKLILEFLKEQNHYKHALLMSKQELYWESLGVMREPIINTKDEDKRLKNIKLKGEVNDLCGKLVMEITQLIDGIYGEEFKEETMKTVSSFEKRLLEKKAK